MVNARRFPPPWYADKIPGGYVVRDGGRGRDGSPSSALWPAALRTVGGAQSILTWPASTSSAISSSNMPDDTPLVHNGSYVLPPRPRSEASRVVQLLPGHSQGRMTLSRPCLSTSLVRRTFRRSAQSRRHCLLPASMCPGAVAADRRSRHAPTADRGVFSAWEGDARGTGGGGSGGQSRRGRFLVAAPPVADWGVPHPSDALRICYPIRYPSWGI